MDITSLDYHCLGELVTCILSLILCCNIVISFSFYERRHRLFLYCGVSSFFATLFDIFAVVCITYYQNLPVWVGTTISTLFFLFLIMVPYSLCCYASDIAYAYKSSSAAVDYINGIIYTVYLLIVLLNVKTGWIFRYDPELGYVKGPLKYLTYALTTYYAINTVLMVMLNKNSMARRVYFVFMLYPIIAMGLLMIQFQNGKIIMTGTSSFAAIFFTYITIQSDLIEFDLVTGLLTESKLKKQLALKKSKGFLYVLSIENMNNVQSNMDATELDYLLLDIGKQFLKTFERTSYHLSTNRFAGVVKNRETLYKNAKIIENYIKNLNKNIDIQLPVPLETYCVALEYGEDDVSYENLTEVINNMLVKAKTRNIKTLQVCDDAVLVDLERKRYINKILKRELNLNSEQFQVWYQPIYSIKEKKFTYMEALSRLKETEIGDIPPQEFVEVAENKGLIEKLGYVAFEKVCKFISENKGLVNAVSINFSVYQMTNPNLVGEVLGTIFRFGLQPSNIIMEITESTFIENFELVRKNMTELAKAGVKFYLDDFGTGYSNLSNVIGLPFSTIKMDRSLVLMMEESKKGKNLFTNLVSTFKDSELTILVEGVETNNQNYFVEQAGADYIQGFLYSRPLPPEDCIELLKRQETVH